MIAPGPYQPSATASAVATANATVTIEPVSTIVETIPAVENTPVVVAHELDRPFYDIYSEINFPLRTVSVEETIRYRNTSARTLTELVCIVEPNRYPGGFELSVAEVIDLPATPVYTLEGNQMIIALNPALSPGEEIQLFFRFTLSLPAIPPPSEQNKPQPYGYTERQVNLVDWYLFVAPLDENGQWLVHKPSYFGEFLAYPSADYYVELDLVDAPGDILVAASANNQSSESGSYFFDIKGARTFAVSINSGYSVSESVVRGVTVRSYYNNLEHAAGEAALQATAEALVLYSDLYGTYPRDNLSVVEADFLDGMEFDGLYFLSKAFYNLYDGTPRGYLTMIAVHETAHQWFFSQVGNDQALEPWLDEAWCTFSELVYYERYFPELIDWWLYYRVDYYEPIGWINLPVYDYTGFTPYRNAVYLRGARFLMDLRETLGLEEFYSRTRSYLINNTGEIATTEKFFQEFSLDWAVHGELLGEYFHSHKGSD